MFSFQVTHQSKESAARCGILKSRGNTLNTPCVFLDTQAGLPTFLSLQQLSKAKLPPHGYVMDMGDILYLSSTDKIHSSYSQPSKSKNKNKNKNKNNNNDNKSDDNQNTNDNKDNNAQQNTLTITKNTNKIVRDYISGSVLHKYYLHNTTDINSIHKFVGMTSYILLMDHRNLFYRSPQHGTDKFVVLETSHGKKKITIEEYMNHIKNFNTDLHLIPSENILSNSSNSRCSKNVKRTLKLFNDSLSFYNKLNISETGLISVIEGGNNINERIKCLNEIIRILSCNNYLNINKLNYGLMCGGIGYGETSSQKTDIFNNLCNIINKNNLISSKLRIVSVDSLNDVLLSIICGGFDVLISSYPTQLTQNGYAMIHPISPKEFEELNQMNDIDIDINNTIYLDKINLNDIKYSIDSSPLLEGCKCYTCSNHCRAYIRHLLNVHEMNGNILLQMHNSFRFLQFVENVKEYIANDKLSEFCEWWDQYQQNIN